MTSSMLHPFFFIPKPLDLILVDPISTNRSKHENNCAPIPEPFFFTLLCTLLNTFFFPTTTTVIAITIDKIYTNNHIIDILYKI